MNPTTQELPSGFAGLSSADVVLVTDLRRKEGDLKSIALERTYCCLLDFTSCCLTGAEDETRDLGCRAFE